MTTNFKVNSETNGTLKMKKRNMLRSLFAAFIMSLVSMVAMSFTVNDTTRATDSAIKNVFTKAVVDDNGNLSLFTPSNSASIRKADLVMDANFRTTEMNFRTMAVAFSKMVANEAVEADAKMSELLYINTMMATFNSSVAADVESADSAMDIMINDEAELKTKSAAFKTSITAQVNQADEAMDVMINVSTLPAVKPVIGNEADVMMDALFLNIKKITPAISADADSKMDKLINKQ